MHLGHESANIGGQCGQYLDRTKKSCENSVNFKDWVKVIPFIRVPQLPGVGQKSYVVFGVRSGFGEPNQIDAIFLHCQSGGEIVAIPLIVTIVETIRARQAHKQKRNEMSHARGVYRKIILSLSLGELHFSSANGVNGPKMHSQQIPVRPKSQ